MEPSNSGHQSRSVRSALAAAADGTEVVGWFRAHRVNRSDDAVGVANALFNFATGTVGSSGPGFERVIVVTGEHVAVVRRRGTVHRSWVVEDRGPSSGGLVIVDDQGYEPTVDVLGLRYQVPMAEITEVRHLASRSWQ